MHKETKAVSSWHGEQHCQHQLIEPVLFVRSSSSSKQQQAAASSSLSYAHNISMV